MNDPNPLQNPLGRIPSANQPVLSMREYPARGYLNLRGQPEQAAFTEAVRSVIGIDLPTISNTVAEGDQLSALWLAPNEWLLVTPPARRDDLSAALAKSFGNLFAAVTDVSSGYRTFAIAGLAARDLLARGCTLDLHPRVFEAGHCAQTLLAKAGVIIVQIDTSPTFHVIVRRSLADYLWRWLNDAARDLDMGI